MCWRGADVAAGSVSPGAEKGGPEAFHLLPADDRLTRVIRNEKETVDPIGGLLMT